MDLMTDLPLTSLILVLTPVLIALLALPWRRDELDEVHGAFLALGQLTKQLGMFTVRQATLAMVVVRRSLRQVRKSSVADAAELATVLVVPATR